MKRWAAVLAILAALALTGCGRSLEQRVEDRNACEKVGGTYEEWTGGDLVQRGVCDLSTKTGGGMNDERDGGTDARQAAA